MGNNAVGRDSATAVTWRMRNTDRQLTRRVELMSGILVGLAGIVISSVVFGMYLMSGFRCFRSSTLVSVGLLTVALLGAAFGAYIHSQFGSKIGFLLL